MVGDPGIEPGVRLREGVTVPCHTLRPVAHFHLRPNGPAAKAGAHGLARSGEGVITKRVIRRQQENRCDWRLVVSRATAG